MTLIANEHYVLRFKVRNIKPCISIYPFNYPSVYVCTCPSVRVHPPIHNICYRWSLQRPNRTTRCGVGSTPSWYPQELSRHATNPALLHKRGVKPTSQVTSLVSPPTVQSQLIANSPSTNLYFFISHTSKTRDGPWRVGKCSRLSCYDHHAHPDRRPHPTNERGLSPSSTETMILANAAGLHCSCRHIENGAPSWVAVHLHSAPKRPATWPWPWTGLTRS